MENGAKIVGGTLNKNPIILVKNGFNLEAFDYAVSVK